MGALFLNSFSFSPQKFMGKRDHHKHWNKMSTISRVHCVNGRKEDYDNKLKVPQPNEKHNSVQIGRFLKDKTLLISGSTGFLAKILVEKILRTVPDVGKIYLLIKANSKDAAIERLKTEIFYTELFNWLQQTYGKSYEPFMLSKLVPVVGNVTETDLGLEDDLAHLIMKDVDVIVNSAANTRFDERLDFSINANTKGPYHLMNFAKKCNNLKLFLHVSTAYVNEQREGKIMEKRLCMGGSTEMQELRSETTEKYIHKLNVEEEITFCSNCLQGLSNETMTSQMKKIGLHRAKEFGWANPYTFSKAMGEMLIESMRGEIPVVIVRPSVIESTYTDPFPGWIQGQRVMDPLIYNYGRGLLKTFLVDPNGIFDVIPADMVVNAILASMARHGEGRTVRNEDKINIYHVGSSVANPLVLADLTRYFYEHFTSTPFVDSSGRPIEVEEPKLLKSMDEFLDQLSRDEAKTSRLKKNQSSKSLLLYAKRLFAIYMPYTICNHRFDISNLQRLMESICEEEKKKFGFEVKSIDWKDYITNIHIPGLRRHVLNASKHVSLC